MPLLGTGLYLLNKLKDSQRSSTLVRSVGLNSRLTRRSVSKKPGPTNLESRAIKGIRPFMGFPFPSTPPHVTPPSKLPQLSRFDMSASTGRPSCTRHTLEILHPPTMRFIARLLVQ